MSTRLLYHAWGLRGYRLEATEFVHGATVFRVRQNDEGLRCGHCGGRAVTREGVVVRTFRALPIGQRPVWLEVPVQRLWCAACGKTRQVKLAFADAAGRLPIKGLDAALTRWGLSEAPRPATQPEGPN